MSNSGAKGLTETYSPYFTENTAHVHWKDQEINGVREKDGIYNETLWGQGSFLV